MSHTRDQKLFTISEVAADWHELMIPQRIMRPSIARTSRQRTIIIVFRVLLEVIFQRGALVLTVGPIQTVSRSYNTIAFNFKTTT